MEEIPLVTMRNKHRGELLLACGTGPSIQGFDPRGNLTVGANALPRYFRPDYLVFIDSPKVIPEEIWEHIKNYNGHVFHQAARRSLDPRGVSWGRLTRHAIRQIKTRGPSEKTMRFEDSHLYSGCNSGFAAASLACWMGADTVGVIGVDFTQDHPLHQNLLRADKEFALLRQVAELHGTALVNLSPRSAITALPHVEPKEFGL
jgi:hypothetical protein